MENTPRLLACCLSYYQGVPCRFSIILRALAPASLFTTWIRSEHSVRRSCWSCWLQKETAWEAEAQKHVKRREKPPRCFWEAQKLHAGEGRMAKN